MNHPASSRSAVGLLEIEALVSADLRRDSDQRRVSVNQHAAFRQSIQSQPDFDEVDHEAGDPIHDHLPQTRSSRGSGRLFDILDDLLVEELRSQSYEERGAE